MILSVLYPDSESNKEIILTSSCVGILLYLFLIVYQPFGTGQFEHAYKYLLLFPYALFTAFSFCSVNLFVMKQKRKWTLGSELFKTGLILVLISLLSYFYNALYLNKVKLSFENFLYMFFYTSALGLPVSSIAILARYIYLNNQNKAPVTTVLTACSAQKSAVKREMRILVMFLTTALKTKADSVIASTVHR